MIQINQPATITFGIFKGLSGTVTETYTLEDEVMIRMDAYTSVVIASQHISQREDG